MRVEPIGKSPGMDLFQLTFIVSRQCVGGSALYSDLS